MALTFLETDLRYERDVVQARQRAREIAALMGFDSTEQIRIATATSEIARNAFRYASGGRVKFGVTLERSPQSLIVEVTDKGKGIPNLPEILEGRYQSRTGMGMGLVGTRRLMDDFYIHSTSEGTEVRFCKVVPKSAPVLNESVVRRIREKIASREPDSPFEEIQRQNVELLRTLSELKARQDELATLNRELEDTNRGVVALYAELEDRADYLRRTSELKSTFLSNMSHEFRTPLNSILSLTRMLMDGSDGVLGSEHTKQITFIQNSARDLLELVGDLLDLAKIEAGKLQIRPKPFEVADLFGALRGMLKPLLVENSLDLVFEEPENIPMLNTDEGKVSQILRNLISNALKFTPKGEVRISASLEGENVIFQVADTGVGITEADVELIFKEFAQVENDLQKQVRGTGLGLPLSRNLAQLLGGSLTVSSQIGIGSVFTATIPLSYGGKNSPTLAAMEKVDFAEGMMPVLVIEDNPETRVFYHSYLKNTRYQLFALSSIAEARRFLANNIPAAILLDLLLHGRMEMDYILELRSNEATREVPIIAVSTMDEGAKCLALGANEFLLKPLNPEMLIETLQRYTHEDLRPSILLIDDNEASRYVLNQFLPRDTYRILEARSGREGMEIARSRALELIFLDLYMPDFNGFDVLRELKSHPETSRIPVVIHSSQILNEEQRQQLDKAFTIFPKELLSGEDAQTLVDEMLGRLGLKRLDAARSHV